MWGRFLAILSHDTWPRAQLLDGSVLIKFSLEIRLESESFEPLIDLVQKLWSKSNKLIEYLISGFCGFQVITFEPETLASHPKYQKTQILA